MSLLRYFPVLLFLLFAPSLLARPVRFCGQVRSASDSSWVSFPLLFRFSGDDRSPHFLCRADSNGRFVFNLDDSANLLIQVQATGYEPAMLTLTGTDTFSTCYLRLAAQALASVTIADTRKAPSGNYVYEAQKDLTAAPGGSAKDLLQNVPAVSFTQEGKLSLRGSEQVQVLINGRRSALTGDNRTEALRQIPAGSVERIEIIAAPDARYDASGTGGVINIILKKQRGPGFNAQLSANAGTGGKYSGSLNVGHSLGNLSLNASYDGRFTRFQNEGFTRKFLLDTRPYRLDQQTRALNQDADHTASIGAEFRSDSLTTMSCNTVQRFSGYNGTFRNRYDSLPGAEPQPYARYRTSLLREHSYSGDYVLGYARRMRQGRQLSLDAFYSVSETGGSSCTVQDPSPALQTNHRNTERDLLLQADYACSAGRAGQLEAGVKNTWRALENDLRFGDGLPYSGSAQENRYLFRETVQAAYAQLRSRVSKLSGRAGLRAERTTIETSEPDAHHSHVQFFPSAAFAYEWDNRHRLDIDYGRRINRPASSLLNPFPDYSDLYNLRTGNSALLPELSHNIKLSYAVAVKRIGITLTAYARNVEHAFRRTYRIDASGVGYASYANADHGRQAGLECTGSGRVYGPLSFVLNLNYVYSEITGGGYDRVSGGSFFSKMQLRCAFPKSWTVQLSGNYKGAAQILSGSIHPYAYCDLGVKKELWKGRASCTLRITDLFKSNRLIVERADADYRLYGNYKDETRIAYFGFSYLINQSARKPAGAPDMGNGRGAIEN